MAPTFRRDAADTLVRADRLSQAVRFCRCIVSFGVEFLDARLCSGVVRAVIRGAQLVRVGNTVECMSASPRRRPNDHGTTNGNKLSGKFFF